MAEAKPGRETWLVLRWWPPHVGLEQEEAQPSPALSPRTAPGSPEHRAGTISVNAAHAGLYCHHPSSCQQPHAGGIKPPLLAAARWAASLHLDFFPLSIQRLFIWSRKLSPRCVNGEAPDGSFFLSGCLGRDGGRGAACRPPPPALPQHHLMVAMLGAAGDRPPLALSALNLPLLAGCHSWWQAGKLRLGRPVVCPRAHAVQQVGA